MATVNDGGMTLIDAEDWDLFTQMKARELSRFMDHNVGQGNWAFYGSFAMYIWARWAGTQTREPNDIDLAVKANKWSDAHALFAYRSDYLGGVGDVRIIGNYPPGPQSVKPQEFELLRTTEKVDVHSVEFTIHEVAYYGKKSDIPVIKIDLLISRLETFKSGSSDIGLLKEIKSAYINKYG